ncbi:MAG: endonuclease/exonuclease/phosphatase family protein [Treponema sp.]
MNKNSVSILLRIGIFATFCSIVLSCTAGTIKLPDKTLSLVTYNTQTFFDAVQDGTEFPAFKGSKSLWTETKYRSRLKRLKETVSQLNEKLGGAKDTLPDILVLQEIENDRVIEDFCKQLPAGESYPYAVSCPKTGAEAFNTVLLSKYPITSYHFYYLTGGYRRFLRPMIETVIETGTQKKPRPVRILAVHWKSKTGMDNSTEIRMKQEEQLYTILHNQGQQLPHIPYIVCGDFNQTLSEFSYLQQEAVCWLSSDYCGQAVEHTQPEGSYFFKNCWEKIDHIFYSKENSSGISLCTFHVLHEPPITENGIPIRFDVAKGTGYSDHLPLGAVFCFRY